jgi:hypothetical protein
MFVFDTTSLLNVRMNWCDFFVGVSERQSTVDTVRSGNVLEGNGIQ